MFAITGTGFSAAKRLTNDGKVRACWTSLLFAHTGLTVMNDVFFFFCSFPFDIAQPTRHTLDRWDENMMERDRRLTGSTRGQSVSLVLLLHTIRLSSGPSPDPFLSRRYDKADETICLCFKKD